MLDVSLDCIEFHTINNILYKNIYMYIIVLLGLI